MGTTKVKNSYAVNIYPNIVVTGEVKGNVIAIRKLTVICHIEVNVKFCTGTISIIITCASEWEVTVAFTITYKAVRNLYGWTATGCVNKSVSICCGVVGVGCNTIKS